MLWHRHTCITFSRAKPVQSHVPFALHVATSCTRTRVQAAGALPLPSCGRRICTPEHEGANPPRDGDGGCKFGAVAGLGAMWCPVTPPSGSLAWGEAAWERSLRSRSGEEQA